MSSTVQMSFSDRLEVPLRGALLVMFLGVCLVAAGAAWAQSGSDSARERSGGVITLPVPSNIRIGYAPPSADDLFERDDEVAFARALSLIRGGRFDSGLIELGRLRKLYPTSLRITSTLAGTLSRVGKGEEALDVIKQLGRRIRRQNRRLEEGEEPRPVPRLALERADAYISLGKEKKAIAWMLEACDLRSNEAQHQRALLLQWAARPELGARVARAAGRRGDEFPQRVPLALLVAELEATAGQWQGLWPRLKRAEESGVGGRDGDLVRALAHRLSVRPGVPAGTAARVWLELASGSYDPSLRYEAMSRLLQVGNAQGGGATSTRADHLEAESLLSAWRQLPEGEKRVQLGLALSAYMRQRSRWQLAREIGSELSRLDLPAESQAAVELDQGMAAFFSGNIEEASERLARARDLAAADELRGAALFAFAESRFYAVDFEAALAGFNLFVEEFPRSPHTNDALDRIYLLEAGSPLGGGVHETPGLEPLARGLYAEERSLWDEAAELARHAGAEAVTEEEKGEVRAHALLLLSRAEEARGFPEVAIGACLLVADSLSQDRLAPVARKRAGDLSLSLGLVDQALDHYEELLVRHPRSWIAPQVRRLVTELRARAAQ